MDIKNQCEAGLKLLEKAKAKRVHANSEYIKNLHGGSLKPLLLVEADELENEGLSLMSVNPITVSSGGEVLPDINDDQSLVIRETIHDPNQVAVSASAVRMELALKADCLSMAVDAAESIQARNSLEKMLVHNMAACHDMAMKLIARVYKDGDDTVDIARLTNAITKLMNTYQNGLRTLHKIRTGGKQKMTVEHVHVHKGGQAIVGHINQGKGG